MRTTTTAAECIDSRCKAPGCLVTRPKTCPPGCPKEKVIHSIPEKPYRDIHAPVTPGGCLDCDRKEKEKPSYHKPRPCPPGTQPIPSRPLGGIFDRYGTETFLDTFDCQEQPWRSSKKRVQTYHEHSYQDFFRPSSRPVRVTCNNLGNFANCELKPEWRSSISYIPCAHDYGKPWKWRSSIKYLGGKHCKEKEWRSSIHCAAPQEGDLDKPYRSQIVVNAGPTYSTAGKETTEPPFHPSLRYIPEFYPNRRPWRPCRSHVCSMLCYHKSLKYDHNYRTVPEQETKQKDEKEIRTKNRLYFKQHPQKIKLFNDLPHDEPPYLRPQTDKEGQLLPRSGRKPIPWTVRSNPTYDTELDRNMRRQIPSGHVDHFDTSSACICKKKETYRPSIRIVEGPQHHSVKQRNAIAGPLEPGIELRSCTTRNPESRLFAPQGTFNETIIDGRFHTSNPTEGALTEQRAQFTTCKPSVRNKIFNEVHQAYKENRFHYNSTHPSITRFLYEDKCAVVG